MVNFLWAYCLLSSVTSHWWSWAVGPPKLVTFVCSLRYCKEMAVSELDLLEARQLLVLSHCSFPCSLWRAAGTLRQQFILHTSNSCDQTSSSRVGYLSAKVKLLSGADYLLWYLCLHRLLTWHKDEMSWKCCSFSTPLFLV